MGEPRGSETSAAARLEALAATGQLDVVADLDRYARLARRLIAAPVAQVALVDGEHRHLRGVDAAAGAWSPPRRLALVGSFCERVVGSGAALRVDDAGATAPASAPGEPRWAACLGAPLAAPGGEIVGALCMLDPHPHRWTDDDVAALGEVAHALEAELAAGFFRQRSESVETRDLFLRQRMEATLRERDEALTLAERSAGIGVWDVDLATGMARGTPQFFRIMGLEPSAEPVPLETFRALRDPHDRARVVEGFEEAVAGGNDSYEMEYRIRRADGETRWIFGRGRIVRDERGEPVRYFGVDIDITERKAAEAALAESGERLRLAQSAAGIGTWDWQIDTNEVRWSDDQWRLHGLPRAEGPLMLHEWREAVHPDDRHIVIEAAAAAIRTLTPYEAEYRVALRDGRVRWMSARGTVLPDETGAASRMLGVTVDVTDRRAAADALERSNQLLEARVRERTAALEAEATRRVEAEARLHQAQKMEAVGRLTGGVAHDFNNLLTVIIGNLERLQRRLPDATTERDQLNKLAANALLGAQRAASLTQHLLAFSRRQPLDAKPLDPNRLVRGMSNLLRRTLGETVTIESTLAAELWTVCIDANQLESAILNLAVNARDAMPDGGKLAIATSNVRIGEEEARAQPDAGVGEYVAITVTDSGSGMTPEVAEHAFEPFFTTKEPGRGTGLGLSQVYGFVRQSGGNVRLDSAPGRGTSVRLLLPRFGDAADLAAADEGVEQRPPRANTETVLVVEDDARVREHSVATLTELGYRVLEAPDARLALELLEREPGVALLFTDLGLPGGMNGGELAEEARRRRPGLRVLCTTGYAPDAVLRAAPRAAIKLLPKPFSQAALAAKLREALDGADALPPCVLVVEDEALVRMLAVETLGDLGFRTAEAGSAGEAMERLRSADGRIDAAVIDVGLPDRKGDALAAELRVSRPELPIVLASGYAEEDLRRAFDGDRGVAVLGKPYARAQLESALRALGIGTRR